MTRKVKVEAGRDATVDQSVGKEMGKEIIPLEKTGLVQGIFDDKAKLAIVAAFGCFVSEIVLIGVLAICDIAVPETMWEIVRFTIMASATIWGAQQLNGKISRSK